MNRNPADIGGEAAGPVDTVDHGMKFWEKQANALRNTLTSRKVVRLDELRRAAEELGDRYYRLGYFERTTEAMRNLLLEKGLFTRGELEDKIKAIRRRYDLAPLAPLAPLALIRRRRSGASTSATACA